MKNSDFHCTKGVLDAPGPTAGGKVPARRTGLHVTELYLCSAIWAQDEHQSNNLLIAGPLYYYYYIYIL